MPMKNSSKKSKTQTAARKPNPPAAVKRPAVLARGLFSRTEAPAAKEAPKSGAKPATMPAPKAEPKAPRAEPKVEAKVPAKREPVTQVVPLPVREEVRKPVAVNAVPNPQGTQGSLNIHQLRQSFDSQAPSRMRWQESDYVQLIKRLDQIQTEAFILKGKLLSESKDKFFATNKSGWAQFCDESLGMNYTTANQYIRVALECDVMSHQYPDLGFEHFKAILPVSPEIRPRLLGSFQRGSVKALRNLVAEMLAKDSPNPTSQELQAQAISRIVPSATPKAAKLLLKHLQSVHLALAGVDMANLTPQLAWQVSVACSQVAGSLMRSAKLASALHEMDSEEDMRAPSQAGTKKQPEIHK
jgi:hypothetical protein